MYYLPKMSVYSVIFPFGILMLVMPLSDFCILFHYQMIYRSIIAVS